MRTRDRFVAAMLLLASQAHAQTVRGVVANAGEAPVAGVVVTLLDSASQIVARALTDEQGAYRLVAPGAGTYRLRTLRIGFRPVLSDPIAPPAASTPTRPPRCSRLGAGPHRRHRDPAHRPRHSGDDGRLRSHARPRLPTGEGAVGPRQRRLRVAAVAHAAARLVSTRTPVVGAEIVFPALSRSVLNTEDGTFRVADVPAGRTAYSSAGSATARSTRYYAGPAQLPARYSDLKTQCGAIALHTRRTP